MSAHLQDYVTIPDDISSDEDITNFALFANCNLVVYKGATYNDCWVKVMEKEIHTIEKNDTLEFISLLTGVIRVK